ncbi:MAG: hypothetical protein CMJ78_21510 [Planctomycetaceae bacterium]|nr:hypothetical protein [Planctomycetaceae bacterium]
MATATINSIPEAKSARLSKWHAFTFLAVCLILNPIILLGGSTTLLDGLRLRLCTISGPFVMLLDGAWTESVGNRTSTTACIVAPILMLAIVLQVFWRPSSPIVNSCRYLLWIIGWQVWLAGAAYMLGTSLP